MITVELRGRLGNQMFQYSLCRIIAEKNGYNFYIDKNINGHGQNISNFFNIDCGIMDGQILHTFQEDYSLQIFNPNIFNIPNFTKIIGFFQTEKYFLGYEDKIKEWFTINNNEKTIDILNKFPTNKYCYIHFRGGDYKDITEWFLPINYYKDAIETIKQKNKDINFIVITDDVIEASKYFPDFEILSNDIITDFSLIKESKYSIIPNSSFSWWACWLSEKEITIAPNRWFNYNNINTNFSPVDIKTNKFYYI